MSSPAQDRKTGRKRLENLPEKLQDYQYPHDKPARDESARREAERQSLVERRIQEAMANGEFDNLPGKGKPLRFNENPYLEPGQEWAFGLLRRNGMAPEWIERDKAIRRTLETARSRLEAAWQQYRQQLLAEANWQAAVDRFAAELVKLNRQIDDFNLVAPSISVQRPRLRLADELRRLETTNPNL